MSDTQRNVKFPRWVPDHEASNCACCSHAFAFLRRRHHCRHCGLIVCAYCSNDEAVIPALGYHQPVRVCSQCAQHILRQRIIQWRIDAGGTRFLQPSDGKVASDFNRMSYLNSSINESREHSGKSTYATDNQRGVVDKLQRTLKPLIPTPNLQSMNNEQTFTGYSEDDCSSVVINEVYTRSSDIYTNDNESMNLHDDKQQLNSELIRSSARRETLREWRNYVLHNGMINLSQEIHILMKRGAPNFIRGAVWRSLAFDRLAKDSAIRSQLDRIHIFQSLLRAASDKHTTAAMKEIETDLHRTFPEVRVLHTHGGLRRLRRVLQAFCMHNEMIGYCQGMNFLGALLLLYMDQVSSFWSLVCLIEHITCAAPGVYYYEKELKGVHVDQTVLDRLVCSKLPNVWQHLKLRGIPLQLLTANWLLSLYINCVPFQTMLRIWDLIFYEGAVAIFRVALTLLDRARVSICACDSMESIVSTIQRDALSTTDCDDFIRRCCDPLTIGGCLTTEQIKTLRENVLVDIPVPPAEFKVFAASLIPSQSLEKRFNTIPTQLERRVCNERSLSWPHVPFKNTVEMNGTEKESKETFDIGSSRVPLFEDYTPQIEYQQNN